MTKHVLYGLCTSMRRTDTINLITANHNGDLKIIRTCDWWNYFTVYIEPWFPAQLLWTDLMLKDLTTKPATDTSVGLYDHRWRLKSYYVRFQVLAARNMKMTVFWVVAPCRLIEVNKRFTGTCCLHHQGDLSDYAAQHPRRQPPSKSYYFVRSYVGHFYYHVTGRLQNMFCINERKMLRNFKKPRC
jgi:hypothetical protein